MTLPSKRLGGDASPMTFDRLAVAADYQFHLKPYLRLAGPAETARRQ
jgi:hypothetical protein